MDVARLGPTRQGLVLSILIAAAAGCSMIGPTTATSFLQRIETSKDPNERYKAYQSLASPRCYDDDSQKAKAARVLVKRLEAGNEPVATRAVICRTLGAIGDPAAREPLSRLVRDPDALIRVEACRALGKVGRPEDATVLMQAMTLDTNPDGQVAAIEALGLLRSTDPRTPSYLVQAMDSDDPAIRLAALQSLRKITGKDLGVRPGPWREMVVGRSPAPAKGTQVAGPATRDPATSPASASTPVPAPAPIEGP